MSPRTAMESQSGVGLRRRMAALLGPESRTVIVPLDGTMIDNALPRPERTIAAVARGRPDAVLAFAGVFRSSARELLDVPGLVNLTASTIRSTPTRKVLVGRVETAVQLGAEGVAVHVNVGSAYEHEMLQNLASVASEADGLGVPVLAIMYPRGEDHGSGGRVDARSPEHAAELVAHAVRIGVDLGASIVKTQYTGDRETFREVVAVAGNVPVVVAGGPRVAPADVLRRTQDVLQAGAAGVCFGRNVFEHENPDRMVGALRAIVHNGVGPSDAERLLAGEALAMPAP